MWSVLLRLPGKNYYDQNDDENEGFVESELENEVDVPMFPAIDEHEEQKLKYMGEDDELIQLA